MNSSPQALALAPEHQEVVSTYLTTLNPVTTAETLGVAVQQVLDVLDQPTVKGYINHLYNSWGFNNRWTIRKAMDAVLSKKFQELDEAGTGSTKDIAELLELSHRMTMAELKHQLELEKVRSGNSSPKNQVNVQINDHGGSNYQSLLSKLLDAKN